MLGDSGFSVVVILVVFCWEQVLSYSSLNHITKSHQNKDDLKDTVWSWKNVS